MSAPEERRETEAARADEDRRARVLLGILAPLVHRLNNSLAVVRGVHELGSEARGSERELARSELVHLGQVLARLARLARSPAARPELVAVEEILRTHELLLAPLAGSLGVELELCADGAGGVELDGRLEPLLLAACTALLTAGARAPRARLRLVARATPSGLVLSLGSAGSVRSFSDLEALGALARALGGRERLRATGGACVLRLTLAARTGARATGASASARRTGRVLLLHAADVERELVATLLRENGWTVSASAEVPHTGAFEVALVERRLALEDPTLLGRVRMRFALERVELLEPRMRPGEVLALLGA